MNASLLKENSAKLGLYCALAPAWFNLPGKYSKSNAI